MTSRQHLSVASLLAGLALLYLPAAVWHGATCGVAADDAIYLLMADALSPYQRPTDAVPSYVMGITQFPPLYPLLIALAGGGSHAMAVAHAVSVAAFLATVAAIYALARRWLGQHLLALIFTLWWALLPGVITYVTGVWSEFLYMALSFAALWRYDEQLKQGRGPELLAGLALLVRSVGLTLVAALGVLLARRRRVDGLGWLALAVLPVLAWRWLWPRSNAEDYWSAIGPLYDPLVLWERMRTIAPPMWRGWVSYFDPTNAALGTAVAALFLALGVAGLVRRLRLGHLDALYVTGYCALISVWPYPGVVGRLLLPVQPLVLLYALWISGYRRWLPAALLSLAAATSLLSLAPIAYRYFIEPLPAALQPFAATADWLLAATPEAGRSTLWLRRDYLAALHEVKRLVPADTCVYSMHVQSLMLHARRVSIPPPEPGGTPRCRYYFLSALTHQAPAFYPWDAIKSRAEVLSVMRDSQHPERGFAMLVRVLD